MPAYQGDIKKQRPFRGATHPHPLGGDRLGVDNDQFPPIGSLESGFLSAIIRLLQNMANPVETTRLNNLHRDLLT